MEILERLRGHGRIRLGPELLQSDVPYSITVWREGGRQTPPRFDGRLEVSVEAAMRYIDSPDALLLEAEDGRLYRFRMTSASGGITHATV
jgi:hypothetical protein